jgi:hypothetical protein
MCQTLNGRIKIASVSEIPESSHIVLEKRRSYSLREKMDFNPCDPVAVEMYDKWEPIVMDIISTPNLEIELRIGRPSPHGFDTDVGKETFDKILKALFKYTGWESVSHKKYTVYYFPGGKRLMVDDETDEQVGQIKKRVKVDDFSLTGHQFDVRLGISTEEPFEYDGEEESTEQKTKERWSFVRKNLSIDMSIVKGTPDDKDSDRDTTYQIELEFVKIADIKTNMHLFNSFYKVFDILAIL